MANSIASQQLLEDLNRRIADRVFPPGTAIPSENELAADYSISRPTVRRVLQQLCDRNLLEKRPGKGTFVKQADSPDPAFDRPLMLGADCLIPSPHYYSIILKSIGDSSYGKQIYLNIQNTADLTGGVIRDRIDALLLLRDILPEAAYREFSRLGVEVVHFNRKCNFPGVAWVTVDHMAEAERAVDYMFRYGFRKIALVGGQNIQNSSAALRSRGWENAYRKTGLDVPWELCMSHTELCQSGSVENFVRNRLFDALFFVNFGVYQNFMPEFIHVHGSKAWDFPAMVFDDVSSGLPDLPVRCNYVKMPLEQMGVMAIEYLRRKQNDAGYPILRKTLPCSLVIHQ